VRGDSGKRLAPRTGDDALFRSWCKRWSPSSPRSSGSSVR
jgi:hypothetical protein